MKSKILLLLLLFQFNQFYTNAQKGNGGNTTKQDGYDKFMNLIKVTEIFQAFTFNIAMCFYCTNIQLITLKKNQLW